MNITDKEHEYRKPDDIHPFRAQRKPVKHFKEEGGNEQWYQ